MSREEHLAAIDRADRMRMEYLAKLEPIEQEWHALIRYITDEVIGENPVLPEAKGIDDMFRRTWLGGHIGEVTAMGLNLAALRQLV